LIVLIGFWFALSATAYEKAARKIDFSGTWILDPNKTDRAPTMQGNVGGRSQGGFGRGGRTGGGRTGGGRTGGGGGGMPGGAMPTADPRIVIAQTESELTISHTSEDASEGSAEIRQVYKLDGSESVNPGFPAGGDVRARASWDKEKLVVLGTQRGARAGVASELVIKQEFSLSKDGKTLTLKTTQTGIRGGLTFKQVFVKQTASAKY
jgi:hypothetical protein